VEAERSIAGEKEISKTLSLSFQRISPERSRGEGWNPSLICHAKERDCRVIPIEIGTPRNDRVIPSVRSPVGIEGWTTHTGLRIKENGFVLSYFNIFILSFMAEN